MYRFFLDLFKRKYKTLNRIDISKTNLLHNYKYLSSLSKNLQIAPVVKSNGYGHGILEVAQILEEVNPPFFCVDSLFEAYQLMKAKIKTSVLIMGYTNPENFKVKKLPFKFAVYDIETAKILNQYQKGSSVHIFIDTALNREGIQLSQLEEFLIALKQLHNLTIEGVMSHFASTESDQDPLFKKQINNFKIALDIFTSQGITPKWIHIGASGGIIKQTTREEIAKVSNLARAGLISYGIGTDPKLKPVASLISSLSQIKQIKKGERVGYDGTFVAKTDTVIGTLPIGYQDGVDRRLSNTGYVYISKIPCKILGKVSMNITTIDISNVKNPKVGQKVTIYSDNPQDKNSIEKVAKICETISYEILIHLNPAIKRVIF